MTRRMALVLALLPFAGCFGSDEDNTPPSRDGQPPGGDGGFIDGSHPGGADAAQPQPTYVSGTRLRAVEWVTEDGTRGFTDWWDSARNEHCRIWEAASDGVPRCMPVSYGWVGSYFTDASCTTTVYYSFCDPPPDYGLDYADAASCPVRYRFHALGGEVFAANLWLGGSDGSCTSVGAPSAGSRLYAVGAEVSPSSFVQASLAFEGTGRLQRRVFHMADGASFQAQSLTDPLRDTSRSETCTPGRTADGEMRCLPASASAGTYFLDAACSQGIALDYAMSCAAAAEYGAVTDDSTCPAVTRLYALGSAISSSTPLYSRNGSGTCWPAGTVSGYTLRPLGAEVAPSDLAGFTASTEQTAHRLWWRMLDSGDGLALRDGLADSLRSDERCQMSTQASDGALRCLPDGAPGDAFQDAGCTERIASTAPPCPAPITAATWESTACALVYHYYDVGDPVTPVAVYGQAGDTCSDVTDLLTGRSWYQVFAEVPPSAFMSATLQTQ